MFEWIVPPEDSGKKLINFLTQRLGSNYSARQIKRILESNQCQINGRVERFASVEIAQGDHIILNIIEQKKEKPLEFDPQRVLFEDEWLLVYNKPAGVNSDENGILRLLKTKYKTIQLIHRLDRDTTGILLFAKNQNCFEKMVQEFRAYQVKKGYIAIVDGIVKKKSGTIENLLGKKHVFEGQTVWGEVKKDGLLAITEWVKIKEGKNATFLHCFPKTGRTHQLRVHFAAMGHPILGDYQYCKKFTCPYLAPRYLLHAFQISFHHPFSGNLVFIEAPQPKDMRDAEQELFKSE